MLKYKLQIQGRRFNDMGRKIEEQRQSRVPTPEVQPHRNVDNGQQSNDIRSRIKNTPDGLPVIIVNTRCVKGDRKSTRLNSSHVRISYAVFCLKKKINL